AQEVRSGLESHRASTRDRQFCQRAAECPRRRSCNFPISKPPGPLALNLLSTWSMNFRESAGQRWILVADGDEASARLVASFLLQARLRAYPTARGLEAMRLVGRFQIGRASCRERVSVAEGSVA